MAISVHAEPDVDDALFAGAARRSGVTLSSLKASERGGTKMRSAQRRKAVTEGSAERTPKVRAS